MADTDDDGFIGMPPGIFDSGTFKLPPKTERPRLERDEIVFVPVVPGMPPVLPAEALVETPPATPAGPVEHVSQETRRELPDRYETPLAVEAEAPVTAEVPVAAAVDPATRSWRIVLPEGRELTISRVVLVGRNPAPFEAYPGAELLAVADTTQSVSKTHAAFEADEQGLWVHDLNSTNGVWVVHGEDVTEGVPGRRVQVQAGSTVELGDYVLTVTRD